MKQLIESEVTVRVRLIVPILILAALTAFVALPASTAETSTTATVGLTHVIQVIGVNGQPAPDGAVVSFVNSDLQPPVSQEEIAQARERGPCAELTVEAGVVTLIPDLSRSDCPPGMRVVAVLMTGPNTGIGSSATPSIEWRAGQSGEPPRLVVLRPVPPSDAVVGVGPKHLLHIFGPDGKPAVDGTLLIMDPLASTGAGTTFGACGERAVENGIVELEPEFTDACPEGSAIGVTILTGPYNGVAAVVTPAIEWRGAMPNEASIVVEVRPLAPDTGSTTPIRPPDTGSAGLASIGSR